MKKNTLILSGLVAVSLTAVLSCSLSVASVEHHGMTVDAAAVIVCTDCHADMAPVSATTPAAAGEAKIHHPTDVAYPPAGKEREFASVSSVRAKGLRFSDGRITCTTCHDLRNPKYHLVMENKESALCLACHIK